MRYRYFFVFFAGALALSCATSPEVYAPLDAAVGRGEFSAAAREIASSQNSSNPIYPAKNSVMLYLDKGMLEHYAQDYAASSAALENAERLIEEAFTKSITLEIGTYILNDNTREYSGEDYEDIYLNVFNALNYYNRGEVDEALVEVRKINLKLRTLETKYAAEIEKAKRYAADNGGYSGAEQPAFKFADSALARYLAGLFWRGRGNADDARIDFDACRAAYALSPNVYKSPPPSTLADEYEVPAGQARLNLIAFTGLSPLKVEELTFVPLPFPFPHNSIKLALPVMKERRGGLSHVEAVIDGGERIIFELVEDMGAVMTETFNARKSLVYVKTVVRAIVKAAAQAAVQVVTTEQAGGGWGLLAGIAGRIFNEATEAADTRSARYFPRYALSAAANLSPGIHNVVINFYSGGHIVYTVEKTVEVYENRLNLVEVICLK